MVILTKVHIFSILNGKKTIFKLVNSILHGAERQREEKEGGTYEGEKQGDTEGRKRGRNRGGREAGRHKGEK
jgi:hypothetical protein